MVDTKQDGDDDELAAKRLTRRYCVNAIVKKLMSECVCFKISIRQTPRLMEVVSLDND